MTTDKPYGTKQMAKDIGPLTFGNSLETYRKCEGVSQKDFAEKLGISPSSLCDIERGRKIPSPRRAAKIANQIGEPEVFWLKLAFQDMLRKENLNYTVSVA